MKDSTPPAERLCLLRDGFWEETAVYTSEPHGLIVRKASKATQKPGPWALESLRREIRYLKELPDSCKDLFPTVLRSWDTPNLQRPEVGYEIPFYHDWMSLAERITEVPHPSVQEAEACQDKLSELLFQKLHQSVVPSESLAKHVTTSIESALQQLAVHEAFHSLTESAAITLNGERTAGPRALWTRIVHSGLPSLLDQGPQVRLHGDLIPENILCPRDNSAWWNALLFIDPVSVAGIAAGPPLFDFVKYESYACGELLAIRSETCVAQQDDLNAYTFSWSHGTPSIAPYANGRWHETLRRRFEAHHGPIQESLYHLLDAYFSLVMAVNTSGKQQWARILKGTLAMKQAIEKTRI